MLTYKKNARKEFYVLSRPSMKACDWLAKYCPTGPTPSLNQ